MSRFKHLGTTHKQVIVEGGLNVIYTIFYTKQLKTITRQKRKKPTNYKYYYLSNVLVYLQTIVQSSLLDEDKMPFPPHRLIFRKIGHHCSSVSECYAIRFR